MGADQTMIEHEEFVKEAEAHLSTITAPQTKPSAQQPATSQAPQPAPKATMSIFRPNQDLKPAILEKECTYSECLHFIELWKNYMIAGYGSEDSIPQETLAIQLQPFINPTWWIQMTEMGIRQKSFKEIPDIIKEVAGRFITVFDRRLDFLKTKKGSQCHSEFVVSILFSRTCKNSLWHWLPFLVFRKSSLLSKTVVNLPATSLMMSGISLKDFCLMPISVIWIHQVGLMKGCS